MRPRIKRNLVASSNAGSRADEMAAHNRREYQRLSGTEDNRPYTIIFGRKVVIGTSSITLEDCYNADLKIYNL